MLLDTREHVAEFNNPGPALAISDDEVRRAVRNFSERVMTNLDSGNPRRVRMAQNVLQAEAAILSAIHEMGRA